MVEKCSECLIKVHYYSSAPRYSSLLPVHLSHHSCGFLTQLWSPLSWVSLVVLSWMLQCPQLIHNIPLSFFYFYLFFTFFIFFFTFPFHSHFEFGTQPDVTWGQIWWVRCMSTHSIFLMTAFTMFITSGKNTQEIIASARGRSNRMSVFKENKGKSFAVAHWFKFKYSLYRSNTSHAGSHATPGLTSVSVMTSIVRMTFFLILSLWRLWRTSTLLLHRLPRHTLNSLRRILKYIYWLACDPRTLGKSTWTQMHSRQ